MAVRESPTPRREAVTTVVSVMGRNPIIRICIYSTPATKVS